MLCGGSREWIFLLIIFLGLLFQSSIAHDAHGDHSMDLGSCDGSVCKRIPQHIERFKNNDTCENNTLCIRKCCKDGMHFNKDFKCVQSITNIWNTTIFLRDWENVDPDDVQIVFGWPPRCPLNIDHSHKDSFRLLQDGTNRTMQADHHKFPNPPSDSSYCLENVKRNDTVENVEGIICFPDAPEENPNIGESCKVNQVLLLILKLISSFFLLLTIAVYAGVPKLRETTYGRCLISLASANLMIFIVTITNGFHSRKILHHQCITIEFIGHVNVHAIFFWLNVMAFDLWRTVCSQSTLQYSRKKFIKYSLYAWGCSFLLSICALIIEFSPSKHLLRQQAAWKCVTEGYFMHWVLLATSFVNLCLFIHTCYRIYKMDSSTNRRSVNFWIFLKIFLITGISWTIDVSSAASCEWVIGYVVILLQGFFIFIATVCNKYVFKEVVKCLSPKFQQLHKFRQEVCQNNFSMCVSSATTDTSAANSDQGVYTAITLDKINETARSNVEELSQEMNNVRDSDGQVIAQRSIKETLRNVLPLLIATVAICTSVFDVYTDALSAERICTSDCTCIWKMTQENCHPRFDWHDKTCEAVGGFFGKDHGVRIKYVCAPPDDATCSKAFISGLNTTGEAYCLGKKDVGSKSVCSSKQWPPNRDYRHPWWCSISITSLTLSSLLSNAFLMYRLLCYYGMYCQILGFTRLANTTKTSKKYAVMAVIVLLFCTQLLPFTWLALLIYSAYLRLKGIGGQEKLEYTTATFKIIFTLLENIPQLLLQLSFFYRALKGLEEGLENAKSITAIVGILLSCTNAAWNSRFGIQRKSTRIAAAFVSSITVFSRVTVMVGNPSGLRLPLFLIPALMIYELIHSQISNLKFALTDIFSTARTEKNINELSIKWRVLHYAWRCIDGFLFDGVSLRGLFVSVIYLIFCFFYVSDLQVGALYTYQLCSITVSLIYLLI